ncbi:MAG: hypothetical protein JXA42_21285, partial [Anaerolineales bacterium]|nr:hypothetical protein [Anaerolineales bacterium]
MKARWVALVILMFLALLLPGGIAISAQADLTGNNGPDRSLRENNQDHYTVQPLLGSQSGRSAPLMFIENVGQFDDQVRFQVRGGNGTIWLTEDAIWITVLEPADLSGLEKPDRSMDRGSEPRKGVNIKLSFTGANPSPTIEPFDRLETSMNYFIGNDPEQWRTKVPVWGGVRYVDLYPGVDLEITGENGEWKWSLTSRSRFDDVRLRIEGIKDLRLEDDRLVLTVFTGSITLPLLGVGEFVSERQPVENPASLIKKPESECFEITFPFSINRTNFTFPHNHSPTDTSHDLVFGTFWGGIGWDIGASIEVDGDGNIIVAGYAYSTEFSTTTGALHFYDEYSDVFIFKLTANGDSLLYCTFVGGSSSERILATGIDGNGNVFATGDTESTNFPTTVGAYNTDHNGGYYDVFVFKLSATGDSLVFSTFVGGSNDETGYAMAFDGDGNVIVTGETSSLDFTTTTGAYDTIYNGGHSDSFIFKLAVGGNELLFSTFIGGNDSESGGSLALDQTENIVVMGNTNSQNFPTTHGAYNENLNGTGKIFVLKLASEANSIQYCSFFGGSNSDTGTSMILDDSGNVLVTGITDSLDFPVTMGAFDTTHNSAGYYDAFVFKLATWGEGNADLQYSTFIGGNDMDYAMSLALDKAGNAIVSGWTYSSNFPTSPWAFDTSYDGEYNDVFIAKLATNGNGSRDLLYSTYVGGNEWDYGEALALDNDDNIIIAGWTESIDFPTTSGAFDITLTNDECPDVFVLKLTAIEPPYFLAGHVKKPDGIGISNVVVSAGESISATTDSNGLYILRNLVTDTYTMTPATNGYIFSPTIQTKSVPASSSGIDFIAYNLYKRVDPA